MRHRLVGYAHILASGTTGIAVVTLVWLGFASIRAAGGDAEHRGLGRHDERVAVILIPQTKAIQMLCRI